MTMEGSTPQVASYLEKRQRVGDFAEHLRILLGKERDDTDTVSFDPLTLPLGEFPGVMGLDGSSHRPAYSLYRCQFGFRSRENPLQCVEMRQ